MLLTFVYNCVRKCIYGLCVRAMRAFLMLGGEISESALLEIFFRPRALFFSLSASLKLGAGTKIFGFCYSL